MDDESFVFPHYVMQYKGLTCTEVHSKWGDNAVDKITTVISDGLPERFRKYCVDYANRQRKRALRVNYASPSTVSTVGNSL